MHNFDPTQKMYIVVRGDLSPGAQAAQAVHAAQTWTMRHPQDALRWEEQCGVVVILSVRDTDELLTVANRSFLEAGGFEAFFDDDLTPRLGAIALCPSVRAGSVCSGLSLAFAEHNQDAKES